MAQNAISLSSGSAAVGGTASLDITLNSPAGSEPAGVQWTFNYSPSDVVAVDVTPGPSANAAGKTITCEPASGKYTCIVLGNNGAAIQGGVIGTATFQLASSTSSSSVPVQFSATYGSLATGSTVAITGNNAVITVLPAATLSSLSCSPASLTGAGTISCSVNLSSPAPAGGAAVGISSSNSRLSVPASVTIPAGGSSANFNATAASGTTTVTATISASYGGGTRTASVQLQASAPQPALASIACNPSTVAAGGTTTCTVSLSAAALSGGFAVALASNNAALTAPASITVPQGASAASFNAQAGSPTTDQTATVTATAAGLSRNCPVAVTAAVLTPPPTTSGIRFIQANGYTYDKKWDSASVEFNAPNTAGNIIIVAVSWGGSAASGLYGVDAAGNQYQVATNVFDNTKSQGLAILYAPNVKAYSGPNRVWVKFGSERPDRRIIVTEYSGVAATSPLDVTSKNLWYSTTATNNVTSTAATTRSNGELIFGAVMDAAGATSIAPGTGFTQRASLNNKDLAVQDLVQASAGSIASTQTFGANHRYLAHMATFRPAGDSAPVSNVRFVQANAYTYDVDWGTASVEFTTANTAGNAIIVAVSWGDAAAPTMDAIDSAGNQYYVATNVFDDAQRRGLAILYAPNVKAYSGLNRVMVRFGSGRAYRRIIATEYSGLAATSPLDVTATNIATSTTAADNVTSKSAATTSNGQLIFGAVMDDSGTTSIAAGTGFTQRAAVNNKDLAIQDRVQATAGPVASTQTFGASHRYLAHMATFKAK